MTYKTEKEKGAYFTQKERAALHLYRFVETPFDPLDMPDAMTQNGLGAALAVSKARASQLLSMLMENELVDAEIAHVANRKRKVNVYYLTHEGRRYAYTQMERVREASVDIADLFSERKGFKNPNNRPVLTMVENELKEILDQLDRIRAEKMRRSTKSIALRLMNVARILVSEEWEDNVSSQAWLFGKEEDE